MTSRSKAPLMGPRDFADTVRLMGFVPAPPPFTEAWYDHPEFPGRHFGAVLSRRTCRVMRRETVDYLKHQLDRTRGAPAHV